MNLVKNNPLVPDLLKKVFIDQLSILYCAKNHLTASIPAFIDKSTFKNLKLALAEDLDDTNTQMVCIKNIFHQLQTSAITGNCLGMDVLIKEAHNQVHYNRDNFFESDMSIIYYMNVIENMQVGAGRILNLIASKPLFASFTQLIKESLDINKDNARLFHCVAEEYLEAD